MNRKVLASAALVMLFVFSFSFFRLTVAYPDGAIIIAADGSVKGTDLISNSGNTYILTGNITISGYKYAGIQILKSNIVLEGAGFSLVGANGSWGRGVDLSDQRAVTIKNIEIDGFGQGIFLDNASENIISNNRIIGNGNMDLAVPTGIWLSQANNNQILSNDISANKDYGILVQAASSNNLLDGNTVTQNGIGIDVDFCPNNTLRNNQMTNNNQSFKLGYNTHEEFIQDIDSSNTIDGKPLYYWVGVSDKTVPSDAGFVALGNCTNIIVENLQLSHTYDTITLINTNSSIIRNNKISDTGTGIFLKYSQNITVTGNKLTGNQACGIGTISSSNILISSNTIDSSAFGISTAGQTVQHSGGYGSTNMTITGNNITNCNPGIYFSLSSNNTVKDNNFIQNKYGINLISSTFNQFTENNFIENAGGALRLSGAPNNTFTHNNFINNTADGSQIYNPSYFSRVYEESIWDNGFEGNYWNDMQTRYPNATQIAGGKVWDTSYTINDANIDHYPLVQRVAVPSIGNTPIPTPTVPEFSSWTLPLLLSIVAAAAGLLAYHKRKRSLVKKP